MHRKTRREERALLRRMLDGDEAAFDKFADDYTPAVYRFASRRLPGQRDLVREVVQETMCKAIAKISSFRGEAGLATWLCACCRNEIAGYFRRNKKRAGDTDLGALERVSDPVLTDHKLDSPEQAALRKEAIELVHEALDTLPPHYGQALEWKYLEQASVLDIAERLDLGVKAAESLLTRARESFRKGYRTLTATAQSSPEVTRLVSRRMGI